VSWFRRHLGIDAFDLLVHVGVTIMLMTFVGMSDGPEELFPLMTAGSLVLLAVRRRIGLRKAEVIGLSSGQMAAARLEELEQRMGDLEAVQARLAELEERLDFAERLLAQGSGERAVLPERK
jgi:hypothetical protein